MFDWMSPKVITTIAAWLICLGVILSAAHRLNLSDENTPAKRNRADVNSVSAMLNEFVRAVVSLFEIMFILVVLYLAAWTSKSLFAYAALALGQATFILFSIALIVPIAISVKFPS